MNLVFRFETKCQTGHQDLIFCISQILNLTLLHSERPKLYTILAFLSVIGLMHSCLETFNKDLNK